MKAEVNNREREVSDTQADEIVIRALLEHPRFKQYTDLGQEASNAIAITEALAESNEFLSRPTVVASSAGMTARRALIASITGRSVTFPVASKVMGGHLKRETFDACADRKRKAMTTGDAKDM